MECAFVIDKRSNFLKAKETNEKCDLAQPPMHLSVIDYYRTRLHKFKSEGPPILF